MRWVDPKGAQDNNMLAYQSVHTSRALTHCSSRGGVVVLSRILFLAPDLCTTTTSLPRDILIILNFNDSSWLASTFVTKYITSDSENFLVVSPRPRRAHVHHEAPSNDTSRQCQEKQGMRTGSWSEQMARTCTERWLNSIPLGSLANHLLFKLSTNLKSHATRRNQWLLELDRRGWGIELKK